MESGSIADTVADQCHLVGDQGQVRRISAPPWRDRAAVEGEEVGEATRDSPRFLRFRLLREVEAWCLQVPRRAERDRQLVEF